MFRSKAAAIISGGLILAALGLSLWTPAAVASPPQGFYDTDTPVPSDTPVPTNPAPPSHPENTPMPILFDPLVTKMVDIQRAEVGDPVQYTIVVTNPNSVDVVNIVIVDPLPDVVDFLSATTPVGTYGYDAGTHTLTFNVGTLGPQQVIFLVIHTRVNSRGQAPNEFRNFCHLTWDDGRSVDSNTQTVTIVPSHLPATGQGPGWRIGLNLALVGLLGVGLLGLGGAFIFRRLRPGR
jgi:uncharacterized repeat protein (TIGR01451 family)